MPSAHILIEPSFTYEGERRPDTDSACHYWCPCGHHGDGWTFATPDGRVAADCDRCGAVLIVSYLSSQDSVRAA